MNLEDIENAWKDNDKRIEDSVQVKTEYMKALQIHYALKKYESILKETQIGKIFLYIMLLSLFFMAGYFTNNLLTFSIISIGIISSIILANFFHSGSGPIILIIFTIYQGKGIWEMS